MKQKLKEWGKAFFYAFLVLLLLHLFVFERYTIPSSSMQYALLPGDMVVVNKLSYGARTPITPLTIPFTHQSWPGYPELQSYLDWISLPFGRIPGYDDITVGDVIVFNYPGEDYHPIDHRTYYIKRVAAGPGDTILIKKGNVLLNNALCVDSPTIARLHRIKTNTDLSWEKLMEMNITDGGKMGMAHTWMLNLTKEQADRIETWPEVAKIKLAEEDPDYLKTNVYPFHHFDWDANNLGPIVVPKEGMTIKLDAATRSLYAKVIKDHEGCEEDINGLKEFTFSKNYYYTLGDNRSNSSDSRFWGLLPEDHIVGKASLVLMSRDSEGNYRGDRWFKSIN